MKTILMLMSVLFFVLNLLAGPYEAESKVTVKVIDENGNPMNEVKVTFGYEHLKTFNPWDGRTYTTIKGITDTNGLFTATSRGLSGVGVSAQKDGFYESSGGYRFNGEPVDGKWQPWNPTITLRMRKKINPVPMYAKRINSLKFPSFNEPVGYDFMIGDMVEPYGKGKVKDILIAFKLEYEKEIDTRYGKDIHYGYQIEVKMPNKGDGFCPIPKEQIIPESDFKLPYEAPENGYVEKLVFTQDDEKNIKSLEPDADN